MKGFTLAILAALTVTPSAAFALTGNDIYGWAIEFEKSGDTQTTATSAYAGYVSGVTDALSSILFCPPNSVTYLQSASIVAKYLRNNPEERNKLASALIVSAMQKAYPCKK